MRTRAQSSRWSPATPRRARRLSRATTIGPSRGGGGYFNEASRAALRWARETLTQEQKSFFASLPLVERAGDVCYVHASAAKPERWDYIDSSAAAKRCADAANACYTFCGPRPRSAVASLGRTARFSPGSNFIARRRRRQCRQHAPRSRPGRITSISSCWERRPRPNERLPGGVPSPQVLRQTQTAASTSCASRSTDRR